MSDPTASTMASTDSGAIPSLDSSIGAFIIGTFIGLIQYGWTVHQCYHYFRAYPEDKRLLRILVILVLILETLHSIMCAHACYWSLVINYFKPAALLSLDTWSAQAFGLISGTTIFFTDVFFIHRAYIIGGQRLRPLVFIAAAMAVIMLGFSYGSSIVPIVINARHERGGLQGTFLSWLNSATTGACTAADILLAFVLTVSLYRSRSGIKNTDSVIDTLVMYTITTGSLTCIVNLCSFVMAIVRPRDLIFASIDIVGTKLYATSMMTAYVPTAVSPPSAPSDSVRTPLRSLAAHAPSQPELPPHARPPSANAVDLNVLELSDVGAWTTSGGGAGDTRCTMTFAPQKTATRRLLRWAQLAPGLHARRTLRRLCDGATLLGRRGQDDKVVPIAVF
ncbi:uncharacterized protein BXZ73DRAFT_103162 [Epithele typhae]|uniref:uncharacterized protein n=1 Tax=Epithele typhae TaxID=378194 RepID=UPI0020080A1C|nr:uncharacterized protein BXZ73DRAFT_103162 [Epithele typhae]KAH9925625.1 hypothetical protein BXZ73DRAFT_103162 [Epithele typhae]